MHSCVKHLVALDKTNGFVELARAIHFSNERLEVGLVEELRKLVDRGGVGAVWKMDANGENQVRLLGDVGFQTTADLYLDEAAQQLYVSNTGNGTVIVLSTK